MPTAITHAVIAGAAVAAAGRREKPLRLWCTAIAVSVLPDADVIGFSLGVQYEDFLGHRGFFHSPFFALILSVFCVLVYFRELRPLSRRWWGYVAFLAVLGASHGILDAMTDGGLGIALLAPFANTRYFLPWAPIPVAPIGLAAFFSKWGLEIIEWEMVYIWLPVCAAAAALTLTLGGRRRLRRAARSSSSRG